MVDVRNIEGELRSPNFPQQFGPDNCTIWIFHKKDRDVVTLRSASLSSELCVRVCVCVCVCFHVCDTASPSSVAINTMQPPFLKEHLKSQTKVVMLSDRLGCL